MLKMIYTGMKRRKKETWYVSLVTFIAVLFMTGMTLFQNIMNEYVFSTNLHNYGNWIISSVNRTCKHPYLKTESSITTGISLVDEDLETLKLYAGKTDENFQKMYHEILYEGRLPEKADEIAMEISALAILGYSYEPGQMIEVTYLNELGERQTKDYELVGTLKNFSTVWKSEDGFPLPNFFVTEQEFEVYETERFTTYFYQLNPVYSEINTREFAMSFSANEESAIENPVIYNDYVYENKVWGSREMFENVTRAIMLIGTLAIGYLLIAYTGKRRETYYRYRSIGASKMQIRGIVCFECFMITIPQVVFGILGAYGGAFFICNIAQKNGFAVHHQVDVSLLIQQVAAALVVIVFAVIAAQCSISDKRISGNTGKVKPSKYKALHRVAKRTKCPEKTVFQRQHVLHPMQRVLSALFSVLVCGCLILCLFKIYDRYGVTKRILDRNQDFTMKYEDVEGYYYETGSPEYIWYTETFKPADFSLGVDEQFLEAVKTSPGVKSIELFWDDTTHVFEWENIEQSQIFLWMKSQQIYHTPLEYDMEMLFYEDVAAIKERLLEEELEVLEEEQNIDWDAVARGEQVIMFICTVFNEVIWNEEEPEDIFHHLEEKTLHVGDTMDVVHFQEDTKTSVEVGGILYDGRDGLSDFYSKGFLLVGTRAFAEKMAVNENKELRYNNMEIMYDNHSSYESTDKQLAALAVNNGMDYYSGAEARRMAKQEMVQDFGIYGILLVVIFVVYITMQNSFLTSRLKFMEEKYWILKRVGMSDEQYIRSAVWSEAKGYLWIWAGIMTGYLFIFWERCVWNKAMGTYEEYIVETAIQSVLYLEDIWFILFTLFLYLLMLGTASLRIKTMTNMANNK